MMGEWEKMGLHLLSMTVLASGSSDAAIVISVILLLVFFLVMGYIMFQKNGGNEEPAEDSATVHASPAGKETASKENLRPEKETAPVTGRKETVDAETIDEKFARYNRMWVCAYCETLNRCLPGDILLSERAMPAKEASAAPQAALRGNLLKKTAAAPGGNQQPECIACGKRRIRHV